MTVLYYILIQLSIFRYFSKFFFFNCWQVYFFLLWFLWNLFLKYCYFHVIKPQYLITKTLFNRFSIQECMLFHKPLFAYRVHFNAINSGFSHKGSISLVLYICYCGFWCLMQIYEDQKPLIHELPPLCFKVLRSNKALIAVHRMVQLHRTQQLMPSWQPGSLFMMVTWKMKEPL